MSKEKYTKTFVLPNGEETKVLETYEGRFLAIPVQRIYKDEKRAEKNVLMDKKWVECDCRKPEKSSSFYDREAGELYYATDTMIVAVDKDWVEYPTVNYYDQECSNTKATTKIEIILQVESYSRRLLKKWTGNLTCYDWMQGLADTLWEEFCEGEYHAELNEEDDIPKLEMYTDEGESCWIEFESESKIGDSIISVRVVEFKNEIVEPNG